MKKKLISLLLALVTILSFTVPAYAASTGFSGDGLYTLTPACAPKLRLDVSGGSKSNGANVQVYTANNTASQQFYITSSGGGYYVITAKVSGKVLDVQNASKRSGANVYQYTYSNGSNQVWLLKSAGNGYYYICPSNNTNLALDVSGSSTKSGTNVQVYTSNRTNAQKWRLTKVSSSTSGSTISSIRSTTGSSAASFSIRTSGGSSKVKVDIGNTARTSSRIYLENSATVSVRIVSSSGVVIVNDTLKGKTKTYSIPAKYTSYTVYVSKYVWRGNSLLTSTIAGGNNFTNLGNYCQISLTNATLR